MLACAADNGGAAAPEQLQEAVLQTLQLLKDGGFLEDFRVAWGGLPNLPEQPYGEPVLAAPADGSAASQAEIGAADTDDVQVFQVQLQFLPGSNLGLPMAF